MDDNATQHDVERNEDAGADDAAPIVMASSRPDDPAVVAAAAGKTAPERSTENPHPRSPSRQHNRGPPLDDDDGDGRLAGDLLVGAGAIRAFLVHLGMPESVDPYYLKRSGHWPIGNTAGADGKIIASKRRLLRHLERITRGTTAA
jgi:hypothetical protein